jgi:ribosomal protein S3AE
MAKGKIVKKRWVPIVTPKIFGGRELGETFVSEAPVALGKTVSTSLANITGDPQKQNILLKFRIVDFTGEKLTTEIISYRISPSVVRKMVRRTRDKIDDSFPLKTKDGKIIRIKPMLVTRARTTSSVLKALRNAARDFLARMVLKFDYENLMHEIVEKKLQKSMMQELRKILPLSVSEIRECSSIPKDVAEKQKIVIYKPKPEKPAKTEKQEKPKPAEKTKPTEKQVPAEKPKPVEKTPAEEPKPAEKPKPD